MITPLKSYLTIILINFLSLTAGAQNNLQIYRVPLYTNVQKITNDIYACYDQKKLIFTDYKGTLLTNQKFDSCQPLLDIGVIVTLKKNGLSGKDNIYGVINCLTHEFIEFPKHFDFFLGSYSDFLFFKSDTATYMVDKKFKVTLCKNLTAKDELSSGVGYTSTITDEQLNSGFRMTEIDGYKNYVVCKRLIKIGPVIYRDIETGKTVYSSHAPLFAWGIFDLTQQKFVIDPKYGYIGKLDPHLTKIRNADSLRCDYIDFTGNITLHAHQYQAAGDFSQGLAPVEIDNLWGFIDRQNHLVIQVKYDDQPDGFQYGMCIVRKNHRYGLINKMGQELIPAIYDNLAPIETSGDDITLKGVLFTHFVFNKSINDFLFEADSGKYTSIISAHNHVIVGHKLDVAEMGQSIIALNPDSSGDIINLVNHSKYHIQNNEVLDGDPQRNILVLKRNGKASICTLDGENLFNTDFTDAKMPYNNYIWLKKNNLWGVGFSKKFGPPEIQWALPDVVYLENHTGDISIKAKIFSYSALKNVSVVLNGKKENLGPSEILAGTNPEEFNIFKQYHLPDELKGKPLFVTLNSVNAVGGVNESKLFLPGKSARVPNTIKKLAIIIGNRNYTVGFCRLSSPIRDANAIKDQFKKSGYDVLEDSDLNYKQFSQKLMTYKNTANKYQQVVFYFSGHGIGVFDNQFLMPVNASINDLKDLKVQAISLNQILDMRPVNNKSFVIITDACRNITTNLDDEISHADNETVASLKLRPLPTNSAIWLSTNKNNDSQDYIGKEKCSLFTTSLTKLLAINNIPLLQLERYVNLFMKQDYTEFDLQQRSELRSNLTTDYSLNP